MPFLTEASLRNPTGLALDDADGPWIYDELRLEAEGVAQRLLFLGVRPGQVIALSGPLDRSSLSALHGIWMVGGVVAPLNQRWSDRERREALELLLPSHLLVAGSSPEELDAGSGAPGPELFQIGDVHTGFLPRLGEVERHAGPLPGLDPNREAARVLSSGTGGRPHAVELSVRNLLSSADGARERLELGSSDRWFGSLSLAHIGGLALVSRAALLGCSLVLRGSFRAPLLAELVTSGSISHASLVPTMLHQFLEIWGEKTPPETLRCLLIGGAAVGDGLLQSALDRGLPIALTYGLSEASSQVATAPPDLVRRKPGTVGHPLPGVEVRLSPEKEVLVRGPTVAPREMLSDGWLHTGDLARMDGDGHLWITGRMSDRIISGGVNVDPAEVEELLKSHPAVGQVVVVGIPDEKWGERVVAGVVCREESPGLLAEFHEFARENLSPGKRPREFKLLDSIPVNPNGKWDRRRIRSLFLEN